MEENSKQEDLQESYLSSLQELKEGALVSGTIVAIDEQDSVALVDISYKSEGRVPLAEFQTAPRVGDVLEFVLIRKESRGGFVQLSRSAAEKRVFQKDLEEKLKEGGLLKGVIKKSVKGGFRVELFPFLEAFLPYSRADVNLVEDPESLIGVESFFYVDRWERKRQGLSIVLDRRRYRLEEVNEKKKNFFAEHKEGDVVEGTVKSFVSFGAFIDLGGFDGLLHLSSISWGRAQKAKDFLKKGELLHLRITSLDVNSGRINLSLKDMQEDPWHSIESRYPVGSVVVGHVKKVVEFGAFVEIEPGIEGLVHLSEISWTHHVESVDQILKPREEIRVKVLALDPENHRLSLGIKQLEDNPWDRLQQEKDQDQVLSLRIQEVFQDHLVLVSPIEGIEFILDHRDVDWSEAKGDLTQSFSSDEELKVKIVRLLPKQGRVLVGLKQLQPDPWKNFTASHHRGSIVDAVIEEKTPEGVEVSFFENLRTFIPSSHLASSGVDKELALKQAKKGDVIKTAVTLVDKKQQKVFLSVRAYEEVLQEKELGRHLANGDQEDHQEGGYRPFSSLHPEDEA